MLEVTVHNFSDILLIMLLVFSCSELFLLSDLGFSVEFVSIEAFRNNPFSTLTNESLSQSLMNLISGFLSLFNLKCWKIEIIAL